MVYKLPSRLNSFISFSWHKLWHDVNLCFSWRSDIDRSVLSLLHRPILIWCYWIHSVLWSQILCFLFEIRFFLLFVCFAGYWKINDHYKNVHKHFSHGFSNSLWDDTYLEIYFIVRKILKALKLHCNFWGTLSRLCLYRLHI